MKVPQPKVKSRADLSIFFDESGKGDQPNQLMGGLLLPTKIYNDESFKPLHELNGEYSLHWSAYDGDSKKKRGILKLFELANPLASYANLIFIRFSQHSAKMTINRKKVYEYEERLSAAMNF